ncbi:FtsX-like permease family protein [Dorea sp. AF36-15AT]|uniref:FtsX-like permease family protein n=1 Tax=Dorea sp. AF36-15AT TaxID=2292041 RepID=UPI000E5493BF|nr:FtsX-like permease family protein [Dorea sp. AF36-15AT]RHP10890.1 ABC transporter permease [Dorea sp. AF36-15AT]
MRENYGIRHIEWNISLQWMKRQKKYCLMVVCVTILACMLMQTGFLITDGIISAVKNQRKNIYGEWEYGLVNMDADSQTLIEDHPFIESKGKIQIYGVLAGSYMDNKQANIGTMDQTAWNIGHLQMLKGHLPENEQEIAMESGMLTALGYQGEPGEKITLNIVTTTAYQNDMVGKAYTYTLCGVIKDYQVNWDICNRNRFPTGIVTKAGAERIGSPLESHMLIRADKGDSVYEDLKKSDKLTCGMEENAKWNQDVVKQMPYIGFLQAIRVVIAVAAACVLYLMVSHSVQKRQEMWKILDALGMEKKQMYQILIFEACACYLIASITGMGLGTLTYLAAMKGWEKILGYPLVAKVTGKAYAGTLLYSFFVFSFSYFFSCMKLNKFRKGGTDRQKIKLSKRKNQITRLTPLSMVLCDWNYRKLRKGIQILLIASVLVMCGTGYMEIRSDWEELARDRQYTGNGYMLNVQPDSNTQGISKLTVQTLSQIEGVESAEAYYSTDSDERNETEYTIDLSEYKQSPYIEKILETEQLFKENVNAHNISFHALGVTRWEDLQRFLADVQEGTVIREEFESGNFCILVLSPLREQDGMYLPWNTKEMVKDSDIQESQIKAGDQLSVTCHGEKEAQTKQIQVDAILRTSSEKNIHPPYPGGTGICAVTGKNFWKQYGINTVDDYCEKVRILLDDTADAYDAETHILSCVKKAGNIDLINYHEEYAGRQQTYYSVTGTFIIFGIFYLIMVVIVVSQLLAAERQDKARNHQILYALGMEEAFFKKMRCIEVVLECGIALVLGVVGTILFYIIR